MPEPGPVLPPPKDLSYFTNYQEYNKTLRTWFVSFGVGGPVLLLINPSLLEALKRAELAAWVVTLFLIGCACQIAIALINKTAAWYMCCGEDDAHFKPTGRYRASKWINGIYEIDLVLDVLTALAFAAAVILLAHANLDDLRPILSPAMPH